MRVINRSVPVPLMPENMLSRNERKTGKINLILWAIVLSSAAYFSAFAQSHSENLVFFLSQHCHKCRQIKETVLSPLEKEHEGRITVERRDIADLENYKLLLACKDASKFEGQVEIPAVYFRGVLLSGPDAIRKRLPELTGRFLPRGPNKASDAKLPEVNLMGHFMSFTPAAIIGAGLIDGINPCAFTVIVFFVSFLSLQGYKKRFLLLIGSGFIFAVFLTYFLLGLGLFGFFYSFKGVWIVRKVLNTGIGVLTLGLGILAVRDIFIFKKTGSAEATALQLPKAVKSQIHKVIGTGYRRAGGSAGGNVSVPSVFATALATGFIVSLLEAVCTGQVYLPTITFVLKTTGAKLEAASYLFLYNVMFVLPLIAIFLFSFFGVTSGQFSAFMRRHFIINKTLLAALFFVFGIFLIWRG